MYNFEKRLSKALAILEDDNQITVAVDIDGTLAKDYVKYNPDKIEDPVHNAKEIMDKVKELGAKIIINTCRGDKELVKKWLKKHKIPYNHINHNPDQPDGASDKIMADRYWDDRQPSWRGLQYAYEELVRYMKRK